MSSQNKIKKIKSNILNKRFLSLSLSGSLVLSSFLSSIITNSFLYRLISVANRDDLSPPSLRLYYIPSPLPAPSVPSGLSLLVPAPSTAPRWSMYSATTVYRTCTECIQHTALLLMILGLLVVVYIFSFSHVFPFYYLPLTIPVRRFPPCTHSPAFPPKKPHCVYIRRCLAVVSHLPIKIMRASWDLRGPGTVQLPYAA